MFNVGNFIDLTVLNARIFQKYDNAENTINLPMKTRTYRNYCIIDIPIFISDIANTKIYKSTKQQNSIRLGGKRGKTLKTSQDKKTIITVYYNN